MTIYEGTWHWSGRRKLTSCSKLFLHYFYLGTCVCNQSWKKLFFRRRIGLQSYSFPQMLHFLHVHPKIGVGKMGYCQAQQHCTLSVHMPSCLYSTVQLIGASLASVEVSLIFPPRFSKLSQAPACNSAEFSLIITPSSPTKPDTHPPGKVSKQLATQLIFGMQAYLF